MEKTVNENREKVAVGELSTIEAAIAERARSASQTDDRGGDQEGDRGAAAGVASRLAEQLYKNQGPPGAQGAWALRVLRARRGAGESNVKDAEVVDAEYAETR